MRSLSEGTRMHENGVVELMLRLCYDIWLTDFAGIVRPGRRNRP